MISMTAGTVFKCMDSVLRTETRQEDPVPPLINQFKGLYLDLTQLPMGEFSRVYTDDLIFRDPVHQLNSCAELMAYMEHQCQRLTFGRFEYLDQLVFDDTAYIKWDMHFVHPSFGEATHRVRGMTHIQFRERVFYHEDVYDMGEMLYEKVPLVGAVTRWLKRRLTVA